MNELLCYTAVYMIEAIVAWIYMDSLFARKHHFGACLTSFILGYSALLLLFHVDTSYRNAAYFTVINFAILCFNFQSSIIQNIFHSCLLTFILIISEMLVALWINSLGYEYLEYTYHFELMVLMAAMSKMFYFALALIISKILSSGKQQQPNSRWIILLCGPVIISLVVGCIILSTGMTSDLNKDTAKMMLITVTALLFFNIFFVLLYGFIQKSQRRYFVLQMQMQKDQAEAAYYQSLKEQLDQRNILIHDIKNHLATIFDLAEQNNLNDVTNYISSLKKDASLSGQVRLCSDPVLNLVLLRYQELCKEKNITFLTDIRNNTTFFFNSSSITSFFGNLLSNAVEAADRSAQRYIEITISYNAPHTAVIVSVINSCDAPPIKDILGGFRTKKTDPGLHGIGLQSVGRIVSKYHGFSSAMYIEGKNEFHHITQFPID